MVTRRFILGIAFALFATLSGARSVQAQELPTLSDATLTSYAQAHAQLLQIRDLIHVELAKSSNKTEEAQHEIWHEMREKVLAVYEAHGFREEDYDAITFVLSIDQAQQDRFREIQGQVAQP
jgi:hypothetical protein